MSRRSREVVLDGDDRVRLATLHEKLAPHLNEIAEGFYAQLGGADAPLLRDALVSWLEAGLLSELEATVADKRTVVARHHAMLRLPPLWATVNGLRGECDDRIGQLFPTAEARAFAKSLDRLLDREIAAVFETAVADSVRSAAADRVASIQTLSMGFAHEVRNPINAARLTLEVLERHLARTGTGDAKTTEAVQAIDHELERVTRLLQEFLAFARPSELVIGERDVAQVIEGVLASERAAAAHRGVTLEPFDGEPCLASVDGNKLLQIVQNLVHNAIEACEAGGHVAVTLHAAADRLHIEVSDTGPGVPDHVRRRMFEPFFTTKEQGTGLGLSIVRSFVAQHGGTIELHSSSEGARFEVTLPRG